MVSTSSKTDNNKHNHTLLSWITHLKHDHDNSNKPTDITIDPVVQKDPLLLQQPVNVTTTVIDPLPKARGSDASSSNISNKRKNLIHFHRPHGLLFHHNCKEKQDNKQATTFETKLKTSPSMSESTCACYKSRRASSSTNDADDEETTNDEDDSTRSIDGSKKPIPCRCHNSSNSPSERRYNRENSVHTLPADINSPQTGFKKLREDGCLEDLDDMSCLLLEQEAYTEDDGISKKKRRVFSRVVIRNDLIRLALNGPFQSPIPMEGKRHVLHVGCSDGTWCIDTANLFPHWLVFGIDEKTGGPCPDQRKVPKNFKYIRCYYNLLRALKEFPSDSFDLVYTRFLFDAYSEEDYLALIKECQRICKPNGYIEFYELDMRIYGNPKAGPTTHDLNAKMLHSLESYQLNPRLARKIGDMVSNVTDSHVSDDGKKAFDANYTSLPLGLWGGRLGVLFCDSINELFFENMKLLREDLSDSSEGIPHHSGIEAMDLELDSQKVFMNLHHAYARKSPIKRASRSCIHYNK